MNMIRHYRKKLAITQSTLADRFGWGASRVANYESGFRNPDIQTAYEIVRELNALGADVSFSDVFPDQIN